MKIIVSCLCSLAIVTCYPTTNHTGYNVSEAEAEVNDYDVYEDESDADYYVTVYDSIRDSRPEILTTVERRYKNHKQHHHHHHQHSPLLSLVTNLTYDCVLTELCLG